jgi:C-terminal peptidase prc
LLPLALALLACQTVTGLLIPPTVTLPPPTSTPAPPAVTAQPSATSDPYPFIAPTALHFTLSLEEQLSIFDELWSIIDEEYLYEDFNGVDWDAIYVEYLAYLEAGLSDQEFYWRMDHMVYRLGDDHSIFLDPQQVAEEEAAYAGQNDYVGIGIYTNVVDERERITVLLTFPGGPAEAAGILAHDSILAVDGVPIYDGVIYNHDMLLGEEGTQVRVTVQTPGGQPRDLTLTRVRIAGALPVPYEVLAGPNDARIGYILIPSFADGTIARQVGQALDFMGPLDGLIIDNRINSGGFDNVLRDTLSYFVSGPVGLFVNRETSSRLSIPGDDLHGSQTVPLVVLSGALTASFGEVFAGVLKDQGRATLIGEITDGNIETLWGYDFADGSVAWIAHDTFKPHNDLDADWEQSGIIPDIAVFSAWDLHTLESDPAVRAALEHLDP